MDKLLEQGVVAYKAGKRDEARKFFIALVKQEPDNERAWGWMYMVANDDKERIYCMKQALRINPANEKAHQILDELLEPPLAANDSPPLTQSPSSKPQTPTSTTPPTSNQVVTPKPNTKENNKPLTKQNMLIVVVVGLLLCVCGGVFLASLFGSSGRVRVLSAKDVFAVSAVNVAQTHGYTVTSEVCEVVSSERFLGTQIVFHAFRITSPSLGGDVVVLFTSNHTASQGMGLVGTVNSEAINLFPEFPNATQNPTYSITVNTDGAQEALKCAQQASNPASLSSENFDVEAWRREAINRFGPEEVYSDGSKDDYVRLAVSICKQSNSERAAMKTNLGADYEGSLQQFVIETFCPYVR